MNNINELIKEIISESDIYRKQYPISKGKALANTAYKRFPTLFENVPNEVNCFKDDKKYDKFIEYMIQELDKLHKEQ